MLSLVQFLIIPLMIISMGFPAVATPLDLMTLGVQKIQEEHYQEALLTFDQVLKDEPENYQARQYRCLTQLNLEKLESAIADCSAVIQENSNSINAYLWRGLAYYRHQNYDAAINDYNYILSQEPNHTQALYNRGLAYSAIAQLPKALSDYNQALENTQHLSQQEKATIYNDRGIVYLQQNQYHQARQDFSQAIHLNQNDSRSLYNLGCVCHYLGEHKTAIKHFTRALEKAPNNPSYYVSRGLAYYQVNDTNSALKDLMTGAKQFQSQGNQKARREILQLINQLQSSRVSRLS